MKIISNYKDVLVLTTSSIEGYNIVEYKKPISAHVVTGTNMFSEFLGSFSDAFGGRSNEFQNQLSSIYEESIDKLKQNAFRLGCNCIIALKVDIDEISGKGKSMFMITAIGTAIVIENNATTKINTSKTISVDEIKNIISNKKVLSDLENNQLKITPESWNVLINNQIVEAIDILLKKYEFIFDKKSEELLEFENNLLRYLEVNNLQIVSKKLYHFIANSENYTFNKQLYVIIEQNNYIDFEVIESLLHVDKLSFHKTAIFLCKYDKCFYNVDDITHIESLINTINQNLKQYVVYTTKKKNMFSSEEVEIWTCKCGNTNKKEDEYCNDCNSDKYGFIKNTFTKQSALYNLNLKLNILKENLS